MAATEPIRDKKQLQALSEYFLRRGELRNYTLIVMGVYTVLRISDLLRLRWSDVYDKQQKKFHTHIAIREHKTGKRHQTVDIYYSTIGLWTAPDLETLEQEHMAHYQAMQKHKKRTA